MTRKCLEEIRAEVEAGTSPVDYFWELFNEVAAAVKKDESDMPDQPAPNFEGARRRVRQFIEANRGIRRSAVFSGHRLYFADLDALLNEREPHETLRDLLGHAQEDADGSLFFLRGPASVLRMLAREFIPATESAQAEDVELLDEGGEPTGLWDIEGRM